MTWRLKARFVAALIPLWLHVLFPFHIVIIPADIPQAGVVIEIWMKRTCGCRRHHLHLWTYGWKLRTSDYSQNWQGHSPLDGQGGNRHVPMWTLQKGTRVYEQFCISGTGREHNILRFQMFVFFRNERVNVHGNHYCRLWNETKYHKGVFVYCLFELKRSILCLRCRIKDFYLSRNVVDSVRDLG